MGSRLAFWGTLSAERVKVSGLVPPALGWFHLSLIIILTTLGAMITLLIARVGSLAWLGPTCLSSSLRTQLLAASSSNMDGSHRYQVELRKPDTESFPDPAAKFLGQATLTDGRRNQSTYSQWQSGE